ncbi:D-tyrosyl-tRNA(Tyr) deacylase [Mariprofundus aestuarium]|uniref:D-tyrosyl-tRNA(Tyr) deacylase n=1 Tax=Mariprofundus aestuarium TaxID=1921086 RepID=A0A2K8KYH8_MARES|nr:D-aminoacyl-tRNA deacylase [Mariprofundus aestuarium]ATX80035.1 D-tyrosyl-tRNA(Tyr) deacylase [Mariprofundus aestuarium]
MRAIIQRVSSAMLVTDDTKVKKISRGIVVLIGVQKGDNAASVRRMAERLTSYRVFPDAEGRMNLSINDIGGDILLVPNFTVAGRHQKGNQSRILNCSRTF